jgi:putative DNA methylase
MKRAIEEGFSIVEINRLAVPGRNAFAPIYQMHKWFARRASCVFRAILLGFLKPAGTDIMLSSTGTTPTIRTPRGR